MQFINDKLFKRKLRLSAVTPVIVAVYNSCLINTLMLLLFTPAALTDYSLCVWVKNVFLFIKIMPFSGSYGPSKEYAYSKSISSRPNTSIE